MRHSILALFIVISLCGTARALESNNLKPLRSPDGRMEMTFSLIDGVPHYALNRDGEAVVLPSKMGFIL